MDGFARSGIASTIQIHPQFQEEALPLLERLRLHLQKIMALLESYTILRKQRATPEPPLLDSSGAFVYSYTFSLRCCCCSRCSPS